MVKWISGRKKTIQKYVGKRSLQGSEHGDQKRPTTEPKQGIKRTIPSSVSSRNHKYRRPNNPSQGSQSIAGPSHQIDTRQESAAERRPVRSKQTTAVRPCPYYLRSREKNNPKEYQRSNGIDSTPQNNLREKEPQQGSLRRRSGG
ncbi:uncharacterized protein TNCV_1912721 [Trichonephila clavipes]|nr:uncharacterized protein TNCV_1912721 [Trichonephila clavipes]